MMELSLSLQKKTKTPALPFWLLVAGFAFLTIAGAARMLDSISNWYWLNFAGVRPGPLYLALTGGLWGLVGLAATLWLALRLPWHRQAGTAAAGLFLLTYWLDRLFVRAHGGGPGNTVFMLGLSILLLSFVLCVLRPWYGLPGRKDGVDVKN